MITDNVPGLISYVDAEGIYRFVNKQYKEWFGVWHEDIIGKHYRSILGNATGKLIEKHVQAVLSGKPVHYEEALPYKGVGTRWVDSKYIPDIDDRGKVKGFFALVTDITERKRAEKELRIKDSAIASSINAIAMADLEGTLIYVNDSFLKQWGYGDEKEVLGKSVVEFWQIEGRASEVVKALHGRGAWVGELVAMKKDGSLFDVQISASMVGDETGRPICMMSSFVDTSERKRAEKELREREAELEIKTNSLEEVNTALRVLLRKRDEDREELEEKVLSNVKELVLPLAERVKQGQLNPRQLAYMNILESNLNDIISPFLRNLSARYVNLTPAEVRVAHLIKEGRTTKEIAELMALSPRTIETHRKNLRRKVGIEKNKGNLRSHLLPLQ